MALEDDWYAFPPGAYAYLPARVAHAVSRSTHGRRREIVLRWNFKGSVEEAGRKPVPSASVGSKAITLSEQASALYCPVDLACGARIYYPHDAQLNNEPGVAVKMLKFIDRPGLSAGTIDYEPLQSLRLHTHNTWELIITEGGRSYVGANGQEFEVLPNSYVYLRKDEPHWWSCGHRSSFLMRWYYGEQLLVAGRNFVDPAPEVPITPTRQRAAYAVREIVQQMA